MKHGKKYRQAAEKIDAKKVYSIEEAIDLMKKNKMAKFDESAEVHIKLSIDTKKSDETVRGSVVLPHGGGKSKKIAVITSTKFAEAKKAGADIVAGEELIEKIKSGKIDFEILIATPEIMPRLASVAKILGPRGLMPSPKTETVTNHIQETVEMFKKGKISFKNDNSGNAHLVFGKISFDAEKLKENLEGVIAAVRKAKSETVKGNLILSASICSTMSPSIKISI